jgi:UDP-GlcNAc:undecaprenyl-phosphate GlcNAc-1-phosphate transferase
MELFLIFITALVLSLIFHPVAIKLSHSYKLFDNPHRDRIHKNPTPVLGGVAMCLSLLVTMLLARIAGIYEWSRISDGLLVGGGLIAMVGFIDDRFGMNPSIKLAGQFLAGAIFVVFSNATIGLFHPIVEFGILIFGLVAMMNAFNILDNMDGVTGGMSFAIGAAFLAVAILAGEHNLALIITATLGVLGGFLRYNLPRAKIFMGDAGALFLGFIFGTFAITYLLNHKSYFLVMTPFLILSYPIFDISLVSLSRMREKRSLSVAAPDSSPYRFVRWIFSTKNAYLAVFIINLVMGAFGVLTYIMRDNPISVILIFIAGLSLSVLGVHLYRNFLNFIERTLFFMIDLASINIAFYVLFALKYKLQIFPYEVYIPYREMVAPAVWVSLFWVLLFSVMGIYEIRPNRNFIDYVKAFLKIVMTGMAAFIFAVFFLEGSIVISTLPVILYVILLLLFNLVFKYIAFVIERRRINSEKYKPRVALLLKKTGSDPGELQAIAGDRFSLIGYIGTQSMETDQRGLTYLGEIEKLNNIIRENRLEKIILVWPDDDYDNIMPIMQSHFYLENEYLIKSDPAPVFDGFRIIRLYRPGLMKISVELFRTWEWMVKRAIDIGLSFVLLVITSPVFLVKYAISKIKHQPFLITLEILGRDARAVKMFAFGSTIMDDSTIRIKPGLPSLLNVFKGGISFAGTVPLAVSAANSQSGKFPGFWRRHLIKPGIFGPAHSRDDSSYFEYELKYMRKMSILIDIFWIIVGLFKRGQSPRT